MRRCLIAIGCDRYGPDFTDLRGAERDATLFFETLMPAGVGDYDFAHSRLLLSPTRAEVERALAEVLAEGTPIDTLTVFFAGHGGVKAGSFYMLTSDASAGLLSATSLPMSALLQMVGEAAPGQTNIVIDACEGGGLVADLGAILKTENLGEAGTLGVTIVATAARNQTALEDRQGGFGTRAILECVDGRAFVNDAHPALDLIDIGRHVSAGLGAATGQTPVVWGLNLFGPRRFCKNPHFATNEGPLRAVLGSWERAEVTAAVVSRLPSLWDAYASIQRDWDPRLLVDRAAPVLHALSDDPEALVSFVERLSSAGEAAALRQADRFRHIEVAAACAVALLPYWRHPAVEAFLIESAARIALLVDEVMADVIKAMRTDKFALISPGAGVAEFYGLPMRLAKIYGWSAAAVHLRELAEGALSGEVFLEFLVLAIDQYGPSIISLSDAQAPYVAAALTMAARLGAQELGEQLFGHLFHSAAGCKGNLASTHIASEQILQYLLARRRGEYDGLWRQLARPSELMTVLARSAALFGLEDEVDPSFIEFDHQTFNAYLPGDFADFGAPMMRGGVNATFNIGLHIFSVGELVSRWPRRQGPPTPGVAAAALLSSLIFPDRVAWFLFPDPLQSEASAPSRFILSAD